MPEKTGFWKKIEKNKKLQVLFFCVSMVLLVEVYSALLGLVKGNNINKRKVTSDFSLLNCVEKVFEDKSKLIISGWALRVDGVNENISIVLKEVNKENQKVLSTKMIERNEIAESFGYNEKFGPCGYIASVKKKDLEKDTCYEILLFLDSYISIENDEENTRRKETKVFTGKYLYNGNVYWYNPLIFEPPNVVDEYLLEIVHKGKVLTYDKEKKVWIYQYKDNLYWIVSSELIGTLEERVEIPMFTFFSRVDEQVVTLPNLKKIYKGYYLTEVDYEEKDQEAYFICSMPLSKEHTIYAINTGVYNNSGNRKGWVWRTYVKPDQIIVE